MYNFAQSLPLSLDTVQVDFLLNDLIMTGGESQTSLNPLYLLCCSLLQFLLIFSGVSQNLLPPGGEDPAPSSGWRVAGWAVAGACILPVPAYAVYAAISTPGGFVKVGLLFGFVNDNSFYK